MHISYFSNAQTIFSGTVYTLKCTVKSHPYKLMNYRLHHYISARKKVDQRRKMGQKPSGPLPLGFKTENGQKQSFFGHDVTYKHSK